jgi:hypothetical protein
MMLAWIALLSGGGGARPELDPGARETWIPV